VPQQCDQHLGPRVNSQARLAKQKVHAVAQNRSRRDLTQCRFADNHRQTGVATWHGMTDPVAFKSVEKKDLVCLGYGLILSGVPHVYATVRKH
jgi:hypothetical protein